MWYVYDDCSIFDTNPILRPRANKDWGEVGSEGLDRLEERLQSSDLRLAQQPGQLSVSEECTASNICAIVTSAICNNLQDFDILNVVQHILSRFHALRISPQSNQVRKACEAGDQGDLG